MVHQTTDDAGLPAWLAAKPRTLYAGFDPTADSMHVGHLVALMILRRFQQAGHRPIAIVGGATGMIGDPSGKSDERNLLSKEQLAANVDAMRTQMRRFLDFDGHRGALLLNNLDWIGPFSYLDFLRDVGKNFSVNVMLAKDSVKSRLGSDSGLSYTEFSYMLLQAYDFVKLYDLHGCELQVGGSDQWGNITAGIDLARRMRGTQLYGITCPLLTDAQGKKMGKSERTGTVIWLSPEKTNCVEFYQYWFNVPDIDVGKCLRYFTDLSHDEIDTLDASRLANPEKRESQLRLAEEITRLVHGEKGVQEAKKSRDIYAYTVSELSATDAVQATAGLPTAEVSLSVLVNEGLNIVDVVALVGLASSKSDARRAIQQGGVSINDQRITDITTRITNNHLVHNMMIVSVGKRRKAVLRATST